MFSMEANPRPIVRQGRPRFRMLKVLNSRNKVSRFLESCMTRGGDGWRGTRGEKKRAQMPLFSGDEVQHEALVSETLTVVSLDV